MDKIAIVVPARSNSTRLPNKMLLNETKYPLIIHTLIRAREAMDNSNGVISRVLVATDAIEIAKIAKKYGFKSIMTRHDHHSGTDRLAEVANNITEKYILNLQGDEPEMPINTIISVASAIMNNNDSLVTAAFGITIDQMANPDLVKVVVDSNGYALYFSRAAIPHLRKDRSIDKFKPLGHLGIYAFARRLLIKFSTWPEGNLEYIEALEQLRFLEHGYKIKVVTVDDCTKGIDTIKDYEDFVKRSTLQ